MNTATDFEPFQDRAIDILEPPTPFIGLTFAMDGLEACITEIDKHLVYVVRVYVDDKRNMIGFDTALVFSKYEFNSIALNSVMKGAVFFTNLINDLEVAYKSRCASMPAYQQASQRSNECNA